MRSGTEKVEAIQKLKMEIWKDETKRIPQQRVKCSGSLVG